MQIKLFTIPVDDNGTMLSEMNRFLRTNKILELHEEFTGNGHGAYWCFCVRYIERSFSSVSENKKKIDYKQELDEPTFLKFTKLREIRKRIAAEEGFPAFAIFTDEELAQLAALKSITRKEMLSIKGIGEKKVERFGQHFIDNQPNNETAG